MAAPRALGRYLIFGEIAAGGMASVYMARHLGPLGFCRTVAVKRLHAQFAKDPEFVAMFVDEARLAARVQHPNVVQTLDVVTAPEELLLVMDYIHGETLSRLLKTARVGLEPALASAIMSDVLYGLHAVHEAKDEHNHPLCIVHRDVSPQNMLVGVDGVTRILDLGIAKARTRSQVTRDGALKGKLAYMAPEQVRGRPIDRRADVFAASVVLWELLTGQRLFEFDDPAAAVHHILNEPRRAPSELREGLSNALDAVVLRGLAHHAGDRFASAREMAAALESACVPSSDADVAGWVERLAGDGLTARQARIATMEQLPPANVEREITRAASHGIRSMLRAILERDERAEAMTAADEVDALPLAVDPGTQPTRRSERTPRWLIALGATLVGAGAAFAFVRGKPAESEQLLAAPTTTVAIPSASAPEVASAPEAPPPAPVASSAPPISAAPIRRAPPPKPSAADCTPPFYFENGIKRYKRHCFASH